VIEHYRPPPFLLMDYI